MPIFTLHIFKIIFLLSVAEWKIGELFWPYLWWLAKWIRGFSLHTHTHTNYHLCHEVPLYHKNIYYVAHAQCTQILNLNAIRTCITMSFRNKPLCCQLAINFCFICNDLGVNFPIFVNPSLLYFLNWFFHHPILHWVVTFYQVNFSQSAFYIFTVDYASSTCFLSALDLLMLLKLFVCCPGVHIPLHIISVAFQLSSVVDPGWICCNVVLIALASMKLGVKYSQTRALESTYPARCSNFYVWLHPLEDAQESLMRMCIKHVLSIGVVNTKRHYLWRSWPVSSIWSKVKQFFFVFVPFNSLVVLKVRSDAYISRSGDFVLTATTADCFIPCAHARGVIIAVIITIEPTARRMCGSQLMLVITLASSSFIPHLVACFVKACLLYLAAHHQKLKKILFCSVITSQADFWFDCIRQYTVHKTNKKKKKKKTQSRTYSSFGLSAGSLL